MKQATGTSTLPARVCCFYRDGFRSMILGRTLWKLIFIKLFIMFFILKIFFFQGFLETKFTTDNERAAYVIDQMTQSARTHDSQKGGKKE